MVNVDATTQPLEVTLVWTDYPASQNANPTLVNDIDLTVIDPLGAVYLGNVYSGGQSITGGAADRRNVEECVRLATPATGDWTVRVRAQNVPQGGRQPFALVVTGSFGGWPEPPADAEAAPAISGLRLEPAHPNPFSGTTSLTFELPHEQTARLSVHDPSGRLVSRLAEGRFAAGTHTREWNARAVPAGTYFYRLETEEGSITRKMTLLR